MSTIQGSIFEVGGVAPSGRVVQAAPARDSSLWDRAVLLSLSIGRLGVRRKVDSAAVEVDADKETLTVAKEILSDESLDAISAGDNAIRRRLQSRCLPSKFRSGCYLLPLACVEEVDEWLVERQENRRAAVDRFMSRYAAISRAAASTLRSLYNPADYPAEDVVRGTFVFDWSYTEFSAAGSLRGVSGAIWERERAKAAASWESAIDEARGVLRETMGELVEHLCERLEPGADGKPKRFKSASVDSLLDFLDAFRARDIAGDADLQAQVDKARSLMSGVSPERLRDSWGMRERVRAGLSEVKAAVDGLVEAAGRRSIKIEELDV